MPLCKRDVNLARSLFRRIAENPRKRWILTGGINTGKTTLAEAILEEARAAKPAWSVGGIAARGVFRDGAKIAYRGVDLFDGRSFALTRKAALSAAEREFLESQFPGEIIENPLDQRIGGWLLQSDGLAQALTAIEQAIRHSCSLVIVDEFGPLEMQGGGLRGAVDRLAQSPSTMLIVTRESVAPFLAEHYHPVRILNRTRPI